MTLGHADEALLSAAVIDRTDVRRLTVKVSAHKQSYRFSTEINTSIYNRVLSLIDECPFNVRHVTPSLQQKKDVRLFQAFLKTPTNQFAASLLLLLKLFFDSALLTALIRIKLSPLQSNEVTEDH